MRKNVCDFNIPNGKYPVQCNGENKHDASPYVLNDVNECKNQLCIEFDDIFIGTIYRLM